MEGSTEQWANDGREMYRHTPPITAQSKLSQTLSIPTAHSHPRATISTDRLAMEYLCMSRHPRLGTITWNEYTPTHHDLLYHWSCTDGQVHTSKQRADKQLLPVT